MIEDLREIDLGKEKKFFKGIGRLLDIMGLLGVVSSILILVALLFDFSQYMGRYSEIGYLDVAFSFLYSFLLTFLGSKIRKHDYYSNRYLALAFLVLFPAPFFGFLGILGIVLWILFLIRSIDGFLRIRKLRKGNRYQSVFDVNIPKLSRNGEAKSSSSELNGKIPGIATGYTYSGPGKIPFSAIYVGIITVSIFLIGFSMFYHFFWRPYQKESNLNQCLLEAKSTFESKKLNIENEIGLTQEKLSIIEREVEEKRIDFKKNNPEPEHKRNTGFAAAYRTPLDNLLGDAWLEWSKNYQNLGYPLVEISRKLDGLKKDSEIIKTESKDQEEKCYYLYK